MRVESGGNEYQNGELITSGAGAMGLMQVMPETYDELRDRYSLGGDPYDPHDNILAGTAYLREMYDIYGSPGFLAAYNAGPRRLDDYLSNNKPLPDETRRYVAMIGPNIVGVYPNTRSPAEGYAMNALPIEIPRGTRYGRTTQFASRGGSGRAPRRGAVEVAQLPEPVRETAQPRSQQYAMVLPPSAPPSRGGFRIIPQANAEPVPMRQRRRDRAVGDPGRRLFERAPRACGAHHRARARLDRARGGPHLGVRCAPAARAALPREADRPVARCRGAGVPAPRAWPHQLHGVVAEVATSGWTPAGGCQSADRASVKRQPAR